MITQIENDYIKVAINNKGAELSSIQNKDEVEFLWQGNPAYWNRQAPILFPIVGKLKDDQFKFEDTAYQMTQHGFARDMEFTLKAHESESVSYELVYDENTLEKYPFKFLLRVTYELVESALRVTYTVENLDENKMMYFSIGAHPGFNVPLDENEKFEDYFIELTPQNERGVIPVNSEVLLQNDKRTTEIVGEISLNRELFSGGVLIYETNEQTKVTLASKKTDRRIEFQYENIPYLGLWSPTTEGAPFVCIEPWCGVADTYNTDGLFSTKLGINSLQPNKTFQMQYSMEFF